MSGPKGIRYTVEHLAAMREANDLATENSRLRVARQVLEALALECAAAHAVYGELVEVPGVPRRPASTSAGLRHEVDALIAATDRARTDLNRMRDNARRARLAARLQEMGTLVIPTRAEPKAAVVAPAVTVTAESPESIAERAVGYLAQLDPGVEISDDFVTLAADLASASATPAAQSARAIQEEVGRLNRAARRRKRVDEVLQALDVRAGVLADPGPASGIAIARQTADTIDDAQIAALEEELERAEATERSERDRAHVASSMRDILAAEGYEVLDGFETVVPEGGILVRKPGWHQHGLLINVDDSEIGLAVVRTAPETNASETSRRDEETETEMCADLPAVIEGIEARGIRSGRIRRRHPGDTPVRVLEGVAAPAAGKRREKPKERSL